MREISLEIIRKCPNNCLHCSSCSNERCTEMLPYETFINVISDAEKLGAKTICLSGGEPFLHKDIVKMVRFIHSMGMDCYVYTSGIFLNPAGEKVSLPLTVLEEIKESVTKLIFNIEAATEHTYDKIMGTCGCFEIMCQSVRDTVRLGICAEAHLVPMALNIQEIPDVVALCSQMGVSKISFLRLVLHGRAAHNKEEIALNEVELQELKERLIELQTVDDINIRIGVPLSLETDCHQCEAAIGKLNIRYDGLVFPCEVFKNDCMKTKMAGLLPESIYEKPLYDIYMYSAYLQHVRKLAEAFSKKKTCETCLGQHLINLAKGEKEDG